MTPQVRFAPVNGHAQHGPLDNLSLLRRMIAGRADGSSIMDVAVAAYDRAVGKKDSVRDIVVGDLPKVGKVVHDEIVDDNDAPAPEPQKVLIKAADSEQLDLLRRFAPTHSGAARALIDRHGDDIRHASGLGWYAWDRTRWTSAEGAKIVRRLADELYYHRAQIAALAPDSTEYKPYRQYWYNVGNVVNKIVDNAEHLESISLDASALDPNPMLFNCKNGTIDFNARALRAHKRADLITKRAPVDYNPHARAPLWCRFLAEVFEPHSELVGYIQRALGYAMTGVIREHVIFLCYGPSAQNGKTTLLETVRNVMGDYATTTNASNFMHGKSGRFDTADIVGARFVEASEIDKADHLNASLVKRVTGGDKIRVEKKFKDSFEYQPQCKVFLRTNCLPNTTDGDDKGLWTRVKVIPFDVRFDGARRNGRLMEELRAEYEGILAWLVEGAFRYAEQGLGEMPVAIAKASTAYQERENPLARFLSEDCEFASDARAERKTFLTRFEMFCKSNSLKMLSQKEVEEQLSDRGVRWGRGVPLSVSHGHTFYIGVRTLY